MKILVSAYACDPSRGSEPGAGWHLARELAQTHDVWVLTRSNNAEPLEQELEHRPQPQMRFLYVDLPRQLTFWKKGQRGVRLYSYLWQFAARRAARAAHRKLGFDLVLHATFANAFMPALTWVPGVPFVLGPVGGGVRVPWRLVLDGGVRAVAYEALRSARRLAGRYADPLVRQTWRRADLILAQNDDTVSWLPARYRAKTRVFPNAGFDPQRIVERATDRGDELVAIAPGRLLPLKGFSLAIRAVAAAASPDLRLVVVGEGPQREGLGELAERLGVGDQVSFVDWVPQDELFSLYASSDVLLFPSLHDEAGAVVAEALAHGVVPIALEHGGPAVVAGDVGWFEPVEGRDRGEVVAGLARSLLAARDPEMLDQLRVAASARAEELSWTNKGQALREALQGLHPRRREAHPAWRRASIAAASRVATRTAAWYVAPVLVAGLLMRWGLGTKTLAVVGMLCALTVAWLPGWAWASLAAAWAVLIRILTANGILPSILDFADLGLVYFGLAVVILRMGAVRDAWPPVARRIAVGLLALFTATMVSWAFSRSELLRPIVTFLLWAQPFALVLAFLLEPPAPRQRRLLLRLGAALVVVQLPLAVYQAATLGAGDRVQGTLLGSGAGAHVLAAITTIAGIAFVAYGYERGVGRGILATIAAVPFVLVIPLLTDAKQVMFALPIAAVVLLVVTPGVRGRLGIAVPVALVLPTLLLTIPAGTTALRFLSEASEGRSGKLVASKIVTDEMGTDLASWAFGLGPAQGISRAAFMTSWVTLEASPITMLGLEPAPLPSRIVREAERVATGSSFNNPLSSALGVFGDVGVAGAAAYIALLTVIGIALLRRRHRWSATAALAGWAMSIPLAFTFDWWEQPPFMLSLAFLTGIALLPASRVNVAEVAR